MTRAQRKRYERKMQKKAERGLIAPTLVIVGGLALAQVGYSLISEPFRIIEFIGLGIVALAGADWLRVFVYMYRNRPTYEDRLL
ncbi:MAG: hypothetical protein HYV13_03140 [Candidatus Doudnabacteria bacterium]|nr:hypothetical protein [Candidatus Doudnabacteria bacterium]